MEVRHEGKININRCNIGIYGYSCGLAPGPVPRTGLAIILFPIGAIALIGIKIGFFAIKCITFNRFASKCFSKRLQTYSFGKLLGQSIIHKSHQVNNFQANPFDQHPYPLDSYQDQPSNYH